MPAGSERDPGETTAPSLPHTWRPFGVRIAVWALGGLLLVLVGAVWVYLPEDTRSQFTPFQRGTLVVLGLLLFGCWFALVRSRVTATAEGLTVVNGFRKRHYEWSQVLSVSMRRGAPWGTIDLSDGTTVSMVGVQGSDGERARRAVREIRATVEANTPGTAAS